MDQINNYILSLTQGQVSNQYIIISIILFPALIVMFTNYNTSNRYFYLSLLVIFSSLSTNFYTHHVISNYYNSLKNEHYTFDSRKFSLTLKKKTDIGLKTETILLSCDEQESIKTCLDNKVPNLT